MFEVIRIPAFKDNYIWLLRKGRSAVVVDPGDALPVLEVLKHEALQLEAIVITHHHADHQGGVARLLSEYPVEVFGPAAESITGLTRPLSGGESIRFEATGAEFRVLAVPGHTLGHLAYYGNGCLFCGDTLFAAGCGRLFEGSPAQMLASLKRLASLDDDCLVYCTHEYTLSNLRFAHAVEPSNTRLNARLAEVTRWREDGRISLPSTIELERATNPFLRTAEPAVIAASKGHDDRQSSEPSAVFASLRSWKDTFR